MVYVCDSCGFLFSRTSKQDHCPDCGKHTVRSANDVEQGEFTSRVAGLIRDEFSGEPRFPNYVETEISRLNTFAFKLPATALQIDSDMVIDILVEYGESAASRDELLANVWAKQVDGVTIRFLMPLRLPGRPDETHREQVSRIFGALNDNGAFKAKLFDFALRQLMKHND